MTAPDYLFLGNFCRFINESYDMLHKVKYVKHKKIGDSNIIRNFAPKFLIIII